MNINEKVIKLEEITGLKVYPDIADDKVKEYIVFVYEDETPVMYGNNKPVADRAYLQISVYTNYLTNYIELKHKIRDYLENANFCVTSISSWIEKEESKKIRHTVFEVNYTEEREE